MHIQFYLTKKIPRYFYGVLWVAWYPVRVPANPSAYLQSHLRSGVSALLFSADVPRYQELLFQNTRLGQEVEFSIFIFSTSTGGPGPFLKTLNGHQWKDDERNGLYKSQHFEELCSLYLSFSL